MLIFGSPRKFHFVENQICLNGGMADLSNVIFLRGSRLDPYYFHVITLTSKERKKKKRKETKIFHDIAEVTQRVRTISVYIFLSQRRVICTQRPSKNIAAKFILRFSPEISLLTTNVNFLLAISSMLTLTASIFG